MWRALLAPWALVPAVLIWTFYMMPMWLLGWIRFTGSPRFLVAHFVLSHNAPYWYLQIWEGWGGCSFPFTILTGDDPPEYIIRHELRHSDQWLFLGVCFPFVYVVFLAFFGYRNNPLEVDARNHET